MCRHEHDEHASEERGRGEHRQSHHRGPGFRGFGRRGFPSREEWVERLQAHEQRLQADLKNVQDLIGHLAATPASPAPTTEV